MRERATAWCRIGVACTLATACSLELAPLQQPSAGGSAGVGGLGGSGGSGFGGSSGSGFGGNSGFGGSGGVIGSATCDGYCNQAMSAMCSDVTKQDCMDYCNGHFEWFPRCAGEYETFIQCGATIGTFQCTGGTYEQTNCLDEWSNFVLCTWSGFTALCNLLPPASTGEACYSGIDCNPMMNDCPSGSACSLGEQNTFTCYSGQFTEGLCGDCSAAGCQGGLECVGSNFTTCARYCCTDADCGGAAGSCVEVGYFSGLRFCGTF